MTKLGPPLIIVSGAPGSGKTTLAEILAERLALPLIARDELKERLADVLLPEAEGRPGIVDGVDSAALGRASYAMLATVTERLLRAGTGVIVESNFRRGIAEPLLAPLVARASGVLVHCEAPPQIVIERFTGRAGGADRHRVHPDLERLDDLERQLADGTFEPLELQLETIRVETSSGYSPPLGEVVASVRKAIGQGIPNRG